MSSPCCIHNTLQCQKYSSLDNIKINSSFKWVICAYLELELRLIKKMNNK